MPGCAAIPSEDLMHFPPIDMRALSLWLSLPHPLYSPLAFATMTTQLALLGPLYAGLAWQGAWLDVLYEAARRSESEAKGQGAKA
jgi:hypothetical protein